MRRRNFLKAGLAAGTATLAAGCGSPTDDHKAADIRMSGPGGAAWPVPEFEHAEITIADLQRAQTEGRLTARALAEAYLARMDAIDVAGPRLSAVIERNPDALAIADEARSRAEGTRLPRDVARHPHPDQGQHRDGGSHGNDSGIAGAGRLKTAAGCIRWSNSAGGRRGNFRQNQSQRVGQFPLNSVDQRMERTRRSDKKSLRP